MTLEYPHEGRGTILEMLEDNEEILQALLNTPDNVIADILVERRKETFSFMWEHTEMEKHEVLDHVKRHEKTMIDKYSNYGVPEFLLKMEAQDLLIKAMHGEFEEAELV